MEDTAENRLKDALFIVEATNQEQYWLWNENAKESRNSIRNPALKWEQVNPGWGIHVGELDNRPIMISVQWARIEGFLVMFWYQCSQVTDSVQAEKWLHENFKGTYDNGTRRAWCDAANFHHCVGAIREKLKETLDNNKN